jgi:hypothetical protein
LPHFATKDLYQFVKTVGWIYKKSCFHWDFFWADLNQTAKSSTILRPRIRHKITKGPLRQTGDLLTSKPISARSELMPHNNASPDCQQQFVDEDKFCTPPSTDRMKRLISNTLTQSSFLKVNQSLMGVLGYRQAIVLSYLIDQWEYHRARDELVEGKWFYKTREWIANVMGTGLRDVDSALKKLEDLKLIERKRFGIKPEKFFRIDIAEIYYLMHESFPTQEPNALEHSAKCSPSIQANASGADGEMLLEHVDYIENQIKENRPKEGLPGQSAMHETAFAEPTGGVPAGPTKRPSSPPRSKPKAKPSTEGSRVWRAYQESMRVKWGFEPPSNARVYSQAKQLIDLVGFENAMALASHYPHRCDKWYVDKGHPFGCLITDYSKMLRDIKIGFKMTPAMTKELESQQNAQQRRDLMDSGYMKDPFGYDRDDLLEGAEVGELPPPSNRS